MIRYITIHNDTNYIKELKDERKWKDYKRG